MVVQGAVVNRGDSFKRCGRRQGDECISSPRSPDGTAPITDTLPQHLETIRVAVLGDDAVGKTSLLQQFMTSVYMAAAVQTHFPGRRSVLSLT